MRFDITALSGLIISVATLLLTAFVVPYIKSKFDSAKIDKVMRWVEIAVQAAEMIYKESGMGEKKKEYVMKFLNEKGLSVDTESLDNMIESAVLQMKKALSEQTK